MGFVVFVTFGVSPRAEVREENGLLFIRVFVSVILEVK